jgi:isochorismate pyruvate lyase
MRDNALLIAECADLDEVRANIDRLDSEIVRRLAERGKYVVQAARFKKSEADVYAPARVEQVVANVRRHAAKFGVSPDIVERGYRVLVAGFTDAELDAHRLQDDRQEN